MAWFRIEVDGEVQHVQRAPKDAPEGAVRLPREPKPGERWTPELGWHVHDPEALALLEAGGPGHRERAHWHKLQEAVLILSGVQLTAGLLYEEAKATGAAMDELARTVYEHARPFIAAEVKRQTKGQARG